MDTKEGAQYPTAAQLSEQFARINLFRRKKTRKPTKKQGKNLEIRKT
jgi:hypothetical protein